MLYSAIRSYLQYNISHFLYSHWVIIGLISLIFTVFMLIQKKYSIYGTIVLGITLFVSLFLFDAMVITRFGHSIHESNSFDFVAEYERLFHGSISQRVPILINCVAFCPFGFFLSEFLFSTKSSVDKNQLVVITVSAFGFSLIIECLQLFLHLGLFELTDLVMNTAGAFVGGCLSRISRTVFLRDSET